MCIAVYIMGLLLLLKSQVKFDPHSAYSELRNTIRRRAPDKAGEHVSTRQS